MLSNTMDFSLVILLSLVCFVEAFDFKKRCLFYDKKCVSYCPRWMHPYHPRCDGNTKSQRTCNNPLQYVIGYTCGWSRCDCNSGRVLDEEIGVCVEHKDCTAPKSRRAKKRERKPKKKRKDWQPLSKRVDVRKFMDPMEKFMRD